jgi:uncharacterized protein
MSGETARGPGDRQEAIDALRGLCLVGIAIVNVPWIGFSENLLLQLGQWWGGHPMPVPDLVAAIGIEWLFEGKFYPQFSGLFGFGAGVLMARGMGIYARRIAVLFAFGVLHSIFGWWGDILLNYALLGVVLAFSWKAPARVTLGVAIACYLAATAISVVVDFGGWLDPTSVDLSDEVARAAEETAIYRDGTFASITAHRIEELWAFFAPWEWSYRANTVAMGAFGLFVQKSGWLADVRAKRAQLGRIAAITLGIGLPLAVVPFGYIPVGDLVAVGYASLFLWLAARGSIDGVVRTLVPLGRCAISGYLGQTLAFTLFFYAYGLAMYGRIGPALGVVLSVSVWALEVVLARWWLTQFELGPVEWLWRSITYLRLLPMRRA